MANGGICNSGTRRTGTESNTKKEGRWGMLMHGDIFVVFVVFLAPRHKGVGCGPKVTVLFRCNRRSHGRAYCAAGRCRQLLDLRV